MVLIDKLNGLANIVGCIEADEPDDDSPCCGENEAGSEEGFWHYEGTDS